MSRVSPTDRVLNFIEADPDLYTERDGSGVIPFDAMAKFTENVAEWIVAPGTVLTEDEVRDKLCGWQESLAETRQETSSIIDGTDGIDASAETLRRLNAVSEGVSVAISKLY